MTTITALQALVRAFNQERGWRERHHPQQLAMSVVVEAAELLECFQWRSTDEATRDLRQDPDFRAEVEGEVADVMIYVLSLCDAAGLDLEALVRRKLERNDARFPVVRRSAGVGRHTPLAGSKDPA